MTPSSETVPRVGFNPTTPHSAAGTRIDPPVSVPNAASAPPYDTAAGEPPLEPPGGCSVCQGLAVCGVVTPNASSCVCGLPVQMAPASWRCLTVTASLSATC